MPMRFLFLTFCLVFCGCQTGRRDSEQGYLGVHEPWQRQAMEASQLLAAGKSDQASFKVNAALKQFPSQPTLHVLNGMIYESHVDQGQHDSLGMAKTAYQTALNLDPHHFLALSKLGGVQLRNGDFQKAQNTLAQALESRPDDPELLYQLAFASYYAHDLPVAYVSIRKAARCFLKKVTKAHGADESLDESALFEKLNAPDKRRFLLLKRAGALIASAMGDRAQATREMSFLKKAGGEAAASDLVFLTRRMKNWGGFNAKWLRYADGAGQDVATDDNSDSTDSSDDTTTSGTAASDSADTTTDTSGDSSTDSNTDTVTTGDANTDADDSDSDDSQADADDPVVVLDCVVMTLSEDVATGKGMNLLQNFKDGIFLSITPQSLLKRADKNKLDSTLSGSVRTFKREVNWNAINYNANILSIGSDKIEVVGRPTLTTFVGKSASFDSGNTITGAVSGQYGGTSIETPTGTKIKVTPQIADNGKVDLDIDMSSSVFVRKRENFQEIPISNQTLQVLRTQMQTQLRLSFGETGMVGGNYQRETSYVRTGVPLLGQIPLLQYVFAREDLTHTKQSILFLVTPRRQKEVRKAFKASLSVLQNRQLFPQLSAFLKANVNYLGSFSNHALIYHEAWDKSSLYHRGDVLQMPRSELADEAGSIRTFLYY